MLASTIVPRAGGKEIGGGTFKAPLEEVVDAARYVLHTKIIVGFMDDMAYSIPMVFRRFGWEWVAGSDVDKMSANVHVKSARDSDSMNVFIPELKKRNSGDLILYNDARKSYDAEKKAWMLAEAQAEAGK